MSKLTGGQQQKLRDLLKSKDFNLSDGDVNQYMSGGENMFQNLQNKSNSLFSGNPLVSISKIIILSLFIFFNSSIFHSLIRLNS